MHGGQLRPPARPRRLLSATATDAVQATCEGQATSPLLPSHPWFPSASGVSRPRVRSGCLRLGSLCVTVLGDRPCSEHGGNYARGGRPHAGDGAGQMNQGRERNGLNERPPPKQDDDRAGQGTRRRLEREHLQCPLLGVIYWVPYSGGGGETENHDWKPGAFRNTRECSMSPPKRVLPTRLELTELQFRWAIYARPHTNGFPIHLF